MLPGHTGVSYSVSCVPAVHLHLLFSLVHLAWLITAAESNPIPMMIATTTAILMASFFTLTLFTMLRPSFDPIRDRD